MLAKNDEVLKRIKSKIGNDYTIIKFTSPKEEIIIEHVNGYKYSWESAYTLLYGKNITNQALVDKEGYMRDRIKEVWGNEYHLIEFKNFRNNILITDRDGFIFSTSIHDFVKRKVKPSIQTCTDKYNYYVHKANMKHNNKYTYPFFNYTKGAKNKIDIICDIHGIFKQTPEAHLHPYGCPICEMNNSSFYKYLNKNTGEITLYLIEGQREDLKFLKIGITKQSLRKRFGQMVFKEIFSKKMDVEKALGIEYYIKNKFFANCLYQCEELLNFNGKTECFSIGYKDSIMKEINLMLTGDCMIPIPGTYQGGFTPRLL